MKEIPISDDTLVQLGSLYSKRPIRSDVYEDVVKETRGEIDRLKGMVKRLVEGYDRVHRD